MSLFVADQAFHDANDYAAAKIEVFLASLSAGVAGGPDPLAARNYE